MKYYNLIVTTCLLLMLASCNKHALPSYTKKVNTISEYPMYNDTTFIVGEISKDKKYGYTAEKPIPLGLTDTYKIRNNVTYFLNALVDSECRDFEFERVKSCCPFTTVNNTLGVFEQSSRGILDVWKITFYDGSEALLYFNLFDQGQLTIPVGFKSISSCTQTK